MTKHSTLTDSNDLHYAKARSFSGDPLLVRPDFIDQILIASDTKKIYLATGLIEGDLLLLGGDANTSQSSLATEWIIVQSSFTAEVGKSYLKSGYGEIVVTLPLNAPDGKSINLSCLQDFLDINSNNQPFEAGNAQGNTPTPYNQYGNWRTRYIPTNQPLQITYISGYWHIVSGAVGDREFIPPE